MERPGRAGDAYRTAPAGTLLGPHRARDGRSGGPARRCPRPRARPRLLQRCRTSWCRYRKHPRPPSPAPHSVPTSADVARLAGVSRATVSYVLNNTSAVRISEPTRRRVHEAAKELGYVPHAAARSLRAGHSRMVLMPAPTVAVGPALQPVHQRTPVGARPSRLHRRAVRQRRPAGRRGRPRLGRTAPGRRARARLRARPAGRGRAQALRRPGRGHPRPRTVEGAHALLMDHEAGRPLRRGPPLRPRPAPHRRRRPRGTRPGDLLHAPPRRRTAGAARHGHHRDRAAPRLRRGGRGRARRALARSSAWTPCSPTTTSTRCC